MAGTAPFLPTAHGPQPHATIREADFVQSVAIASSSPTTIRSTTSSTSGAPTSANRARRRRNAIAQILTNSRMCAEGHRPICQDTGIVNLFLKVGMDVALGRAAQRSPK